MTETDNNFESKFKVTQNYLIRVLLFYILFGIFWVGLTDILLNNVISDKNLLTTLQTVKAWIFVVISAYFIYSYLKKNIILQNIFDKNKQELETSSKHLAEKYTMIFEKFPSLFTISTFEDGKYIEANDKFINSFGLKKEDVINHSSFELNIWTDEARRQAYLNELERNGSVKNFEIVLNTKDNSTKYFSTSAEIAYLNNQKCIIALTRDITFEKEAERRLNESETKYRNLTESLQDGLFIIQNQNFIFVNNAFVELTGYSHEELINSNFLEYIYPDDVELVKGIHLKRYEGEKVPAEYEHRMVHKSGRIIHVNVHVSVVDYNGKPASFGTAKDITDKKLFEQTQKKYKELTDLLPQTVFELDNDGYYTFVNKNGLDTFQITEEYLYKNKKRVYDFLAPQEVSRAINAFKKIAAGYEPPSTEYLAMKKDGTIFPVIISASAVKDNNKVIGIRGILMDITDRKQKEEELIKLSSAVEQSSASIMITDTLGKIEYVNRKFVETTGYEASEVINKKSSVLKSGYQNPGFYYDLWSTISSGNEWRGEFLNKKKDGSIFWEMASISPIRNTAGVITHYLAVKEDITNKKLIEDELIQAKEKAEESDRLKSNFLAQVSHEIRTPLNIILGYNGYLKSELQNKVDDSFKPIFDSIYSAGRRLFRTIDLILNMSMIQAGKVTPKIKEINLTNIVSSILKEYEHIADNKNVKLILNFNKPDIIINSDDYLINQIFQNLVDNAIKYTEHGQVEVKIIDNDNGIEAEVIDTGIGIPEEYVEKLFEPFSQAETGYGRTYDGNGLGLALVNNYVNILGGKLTIRSEVNQGSRFTIFLNR